MRYSARSKKHAVINEDRQRQDHFWKLFKFHPNFENRHGGIHPEARDSAYWLLNNPEWLS